MIKILYTGFDGINNPSNIILETVTKDKIIFKNSYKDIDKALLNKDIENYYLIIMLGLRENLRKSVRIETRASLDNDFINTNVEYNEIYNHLKNNNISCIINSSPTNYLCNYAYYQVLKRNKNAIFIHIPNVKNIPNLEKLKNALTNF